MPQRKSSAFSAPWRGARTIVRNTSEGIYQVKLYLAGLILSCGLASARADETTIPRLTWEPRSDWMNVRDLGAKGDGMADDTAAIQAVLDRTPENHEN